MSHPCRLRLSTFDYRGLYRYSLTLCTHQRARTFLHEDVVALALSQISRSGQAEGFAILAYCFMPDHLHLLVDATSTDSDAVRFLKRAKQLTAYSYRQRFGRPLWQRSAWDRVLRSVDDTWQVIRYLLANPVRAGLAAKPLDYPYSGSLVFDRQALLDAFDHRSPPT